MDVEFKPYIEDRLVKQRSLFQLFKSLFLKNKAIVPYLLTYLLQKWQFYRQKLHLINITDLHICHTTASKLAAFLEKKTRLLPLLPRRLQSKGQPVQGYRGQGFNITTYQFQPNTKNSIGTAFIQMLALQTEKKRTLLVNNVTIKLKLTWKTVHYSVRENICNNSKKRKQSRFMGFEKCKNVKKTYV